MTERQNLTRQLLQEVGLSPTEALIYEFGVQQGVNVGAHEIQKHTSVKRPTVYYALGQLEAKGLVSRIQEERRVSFKFEPATSLERLVQDEARQSRLKLHSVAKLIELLPKGIASEQLNATYYEGLQGVKTVIDMTLYCKSGDWKVIAPFKNFLRDYDPAFSRYYIYTKRHNHIATQTLWEAIIPTSRVLSANEIKEKNPRIMPLTMRGTFESILIIFDNKVALIGPYSQMSAVVIESSEVATMFRALFATIWDVSTPYKQALIELQAATN
jgi:sugar-specific transcriptional regulator TrmB